MCFKNLSPNPSPNDAPLISPGKSAATKVLPSIVLTTPKLGDKVVKWYAAILGFDADIFDNVNTKKGIDWFYEEFLNYCKKQKLNYNNKIRPHIFELKKVYFAASKNFKNSCKFSYLYDIIDMDKDFKYLYIDKLNLNNYTSHECSCEGYDCKYMIDLFNNEEVDIIAEVGKDIENI